MSVKHQQHSKLTEAATGGVLLKNAFLKILQHSQEHTCVGDSFPVNIVKCLRTPILKNISEWLLLKLDPFGFFWSIEIV